MSRSWWDARGRRRGRLAAGLVVVVPLGMVGMVAAAGPAEALPSGCAQTGSTVTCTFSYTGAAQTFTVPSGVQSISITADGAAGGASGGANFPHAAGGPGGQVQGTLAVAPGAVLQVNVGGQGGTDGSEAGGFNGGGCGGSGCMVTGNTPSLAGGGGGASDIRGGSDTLADRLLVAAGGGGGGGSNSNGTTGTSVTGATGGGMGLAGTQGGGGTGGSPSGKTGGGGGLGTGGNGGGSDFHGGDGGGGGGGYHGGGAGGSGGSNDPAHLGAGGGGGGGGSDYTGAATDVIVSDGVQSGNGQVTITYTDEDLAIAQPANITVDATGPSGATVNYPAPAVTDPGDSSPPAAVCAPKPGSVFGIGTTTVTCTVTDTDDTPSTVSASFTVTVKGAAAQLADLFQAVRGFALKSTVSVAQSELAAGRPRLTCLLLGVFIFEVEAEVPFGIGPGTAATLVADAKRIRAVLGCGNSLF